MSKRCEKEQLTEREAFLDENVGLVHLCAKRFHGRGVDYEDIFQAGYIGLIKAADHYDRDMGFQFSTYAVPVILGEMKGVFRTNGSLKISRSIRELSFKAKKEEERIKKAFGRTPSVSEVAEILGVSVEKTALALGADKAPLSLSVQDGEEEIQIPVEAEEERVTTRLSLQQALQKFSEEDQKLIYYRYYEQKTQREIAEMLGMTQVQVSRREKKLLIQLRGLL